MNHRQTARRVVARYLETKTAGITDIIAKQLGGFRRLQLMVNAKNFIDHGRALSFQFSNRRGLNYVKVTLKGDDTYRVEFMRIYGEKLSQKKKFEGIYADGLVELFEKQTGLYLRF